jgi:hypothetical protein
MKQLYLLAKVSVIIYPWINIVVMAKNVKVYVQPSSGYMSCKCKMFLKKMPLKISGHNRYRNQRKTV